MTYHMEASATEVRAWSTAPLPFDPRPGTSAHELRAELRAACRSITPGAGLHGEWWSVDNRADLENVLLYNVGAGAFGSLARQHLVLTRHRQPPPPLEGLPDCRSAVRYTTTVPTAVAERGGAEVRCRLPRLTSDLKPVEVWDAVHRGHTAAHEPLLAGDLALTLRIGRPGPSRGNLAGVVKPLVDGVLCALHTYDGHAQEEVLRRIAVAGFGQASRDRLLASGPLGPASFVHLRRDGLQWSPHDDRLVRIELQWVDAEELRLEGWIGRAP